MKKLILFIACLIHVFIAKAQDTITKKNDERIVVKVLRTDNKAVKYVIDDEVYTQEILNKELKSISYANGSIDFFVDNSIIRFENRAILPFPNYDLYHQPIKINYNDYTYSIGNSIIHQNIVDKILRSKSNEQINALLNSSRKLRHNAATAAIAPGPFALIAVTAMIWEVLNRAIAQEKSYGVGIAIGCGAASIVAILVSIKSSKNSKTKKQEAVKLYNTTYCENSPSQ